MATNLVNFHLITLELVIVHTSDLVFLHLLRKIENVERSKIVGQVSRRGLGTGYSMLGLHKIEAGLRKNCGHTPKDEV